MEITKYYAPENLKNKESFWISVIKKFMDDRKIENQLWDFKETFEMWKVKKPKEKAKFEIEFCEQVASYANADGGVLIVGVTDEPPREVMGVKDLENKLKHTKYVIKRYVDHDPDFFQFQQVSIKDRHDKHRNCLIIAISQTKNVIPVKDDQDKFSYPVRLETGLERVTYESIKRKKESTVLQDNYRFITILNMKLHDLSN